jgi:DNA-binding HxlR family transcriptional regulator
MEDEIKYQHKACTHALASIGDALYVIGGKWKLPVIAALREGDKRFNEIQRTVTGISARVLSNELKELELNKFITRTVHTKPQVVVEYQLTDYADTLSEVLLALNKWGTMHSRVIRERPAVAV